MDTSPTTRAYVLVAGSLGMTDTNHKEDEVLKRMLGTPHKKHEPTTELGKRRRREKEAKAETEIE